MSNNIRKLRQSKDWSMRQLAEEMSTEESPVHFTTIAKIERSQRKLTREWIIRFAKALQVQPSEIIDDHELVGFPLVARQHPVIGMVSAGNWREAVQETDRYIAAPVKGPQVFGLTVDGNSMDKLAQAGATVLVDPDRRDLLDGKYYVVMRDGGEATFKQYRASPARLEPCSTDDSHKPMMLGQEPFSVVGQVVGVYQNLV